MKDVFVLKHVYSHHPPQISKEVAHAASNGNSVVGGNTHAGKILFLGGARLVFLCSNISIRAFLAGAYIL